MEEYMESELSGIFRVKLVTKNIVRGSPGTQFMHMRVKSRFKYFTYITNTINWDVACLKEQLLVLLIK